MRRIVSTDPPASRHFLHRQKLLAGFHINSLNWISTSLAGGTHVHVHRVDRVTDHPFHLPHLCRQRVAVIGTSRKAPCSDEPSARLLTATLTLLPNSYGLPALAVRIQVIDGARTFTLQDPQPCRLLPLHLLQPPE